MLDSTNTGMSQAMEAIQFTFKGKTVNEEFGFEASPRLDWGGTASVGIAVKRISFTIGYDLAWGKYNKEQNDLRIRNHMVSFTSGYSF